MAGSTVNFTIAVKNTGNTSFVGYVFDDANCDEQRTGENAADATLDPGETWTYSCAMATTVGQTIGGEHRHGDRHQLGSEVRDRRPTTPRSR